MAPAKYLKRQSRKIRRSVAKRYTTKTGGMRINRIIKDVATIKRSLNVEHKHFDYIFGSSNDAQTTSQSPTNNVPITLALSLPVMGTAYNNRVGNQIKITHITSKIEFLFENTSDLFSRRTASVRLLFSKSGVDVPTVASLYELDQNGHYTRASFVNSQEWKKYMWIKPLNTFKSHTEQIARYPLSMGTGNTNVYVAPSNNTVDVTSIATQSLNLTKYYVNKQTSCNIRVMFQNGSDTVVDQMKPYLVFMCDSVVESGLTHDPVTITGQIRFTYVDN